MSAPSRSDLIFKEIPTHTRYQFFFSNCVFCSFCDIKPTSTTVKDKTNKFMHNWMSGKFHRLVHSLCLYKLNRVYLQMLEYHVTVLSVRRKRGRKNGDNFAIWLAARGENTIFPNGFCKIHHYNFSHTQSADDPVQCWIWWYLDSDIASR